VPHGVYLSSVMTLERTGRLSTSNRSVVSVENLILAIRWLLAVPAGMLFILCILGNWSLILGGLFTLLRGQRGESFSLVLPFIGPVLGIVFFLAVPLKGFASWWWLSMLIEPTWLLGAWFLLTLPFVNRNETSER